MANVKLWISRFLKRDIAASVVAAVINEDAGYSDHMVGQTKGRSIAVRHFAVTRQRRLLARAGKRSAMR
jgi:hypothetical protein